jgi:aspartate-semialdehyde dehydrogenase
MKEYRVIVAGATGMVGRKMIQVLEERKFPVSQLVPLASERSVGMEVSFHEKPVRVEKLSAESLRASKADCALFSAGAGTSKEFSPIAAQLGILVIDNSSAFRMDPEVPLVVPEVNPEQIFKHKGIIANPNCSTIQMVVPMKPLHDRYRIKRVVVSTYQSVTGAGKRGYDQLMKELRNEPVDPKKFAHQISFNCLPQIDVFLDDGYTKEERKMMDETKKIMGDQSIAVSATCVRVPSVGGHSESVNLEFEKSFDLKDVRDLLSTFPGIVLQDDPQKSLYPMPIWSHERDEVFVGRLRKDPSRENCLDLWIVADNIRKGAATNAVQIAEHWIKNK